MSRPLYVPGGNARDRRRWLRATVRAICAAEHPSVYYTLFCDRVDVHRGIWGTTLDLWFGAELEPDYVAEKLRAAVRVLRDHARRREPQPLWPERLTAERLQSVKRELGEFKWRPQHLWEVAP